MALKIIISGWLICLSILIYPPLEIAQGGQGYDPAPCYFDIPDGEQVECGTITVPENRQDPRQGTIRLYFARFKSHRADPPPDPIVYLIGGPGVSGLYDIGIAYSHFAPYLPNRDVIVLDQRGMGYSEPALRCDMPEDDDYYHTLQTCADNYRVQGVDLPAYTTAENAADVEALRLALGYEQWNIVGVSYGSRLALMVMHAYPSGIRSVILDSVAPIAAVSVGNAFETTLQTLFNDCANDPACNAVYPDLAAVYAQAMETIETLARTTPEFTLNGNSLRMFIYEQMWTTNGAWDVPRLIYAIANGDYALITFPPEPYTVFLVMNRAILCSDYGGRNNRDCQILGMESTSPIVGNTPLRSDIPTLIVNGSYDARTPTIGASTTAQSLTHSYFYEFPYTSHGVVRSGGACPQTMAYAFLDTPHQAPNSSCISTLRPRFRLGL